MEKSWRDDGMKKIIGIPLISRRLGWPNVADVLKREGIKSEKSPSIFHHSGKHYKWLIIVFLIKAFRKLMLSRCNLIKL